MSNKTRYGMNFTPIFDLCMKYRFNKSISPDKNKKRFTLNLLEAYIYGLMCNLHYNGCEIFISHAGLAEKIGCTEKTVRTAIQALINAGVIKAKRRYGKSNLYTLLITPEKFAKMCAAQGIEEDAAIPAAPEDAEDTTQEDAQEDQPEAPQEAPKQPEDAKPLMKRHRDKYGYAKLTRDEMNEAHDRLMKKYKGKQVKLSTLRDEIYGPEYMTKFIVGKNPDQIWKKESYWHCTEDVFRIVNELLKRRVTVIMDTEGYGCQDHPPIYCWDNVRLGTVKKDDGTTIRQLKFFI
ncbi:TPA: hypothetical protein ROA76_004385 [Escherichia coli]|nr:hypothetical protein [Escherichia coli]